MAAGVRFPYLSFIQSKMDVVSNSELADYQSKLLQVPPHHIWKNIMNINHFYVKATGFLQYQYLNY